MAKGQWESGAQNPSRIRALEGADDSAERLLKLRAQDDAFQAAMRKAPERRPRTSSEYDAAGDLAGSIAEGFAAIRERKANGGEGWKPK